MFTPINNPPTSVDATSSVVAAVLEEIGTLGCSRPGLVAVALTLAAVLDNPKATTSMPQAAGRLMQVLDRLRTSATARRGTLALVKDMTKQGCGHVLANPDNSG